MLAERVCSVREEEMLLRNVSLRGLKLSSTGAKHPKDAPGAPLLQTLKIRTDKAKIISPRAEEQKQEQGISSQVHEECSEES